MNKTADSFKIFIVEDNEWYAEIMAHHLSLNPDYEVKTFSSGRSFLDAMHKRPDVVCLDYSLPDVNAQELIKEVQKADFTLPIIMISGQEDVKTAIDILQHDLVEDYIVKDDDTKDRLWKSVLKVREKAKLRGEVEALKEELVQRYRFADTIKGNSEAIKRVFKLMQKACNNNITVSLTGETGTGKELVAKCIHYNSPRKKKPFVAVNMTAIPLELIESELFGHEKGAFTGANTRRIGKFEEAHQGTIFLDEIADMDAAMQAKLLRVLQEREVTRLGSNQAVKINVRVIAATHKNLAEEVKKGNFRQDLYYRLLGLPIELPPLRERRDDILILAKYFVEAFGKENKSPKKSFSPVAKKKLTSYPYPGNIRELKAIVELSAVMADEEIIREEDITFAGDVSFTDFLTEESTLKGYTSKIIKHYLSKYNEDVALVAQKLDIGKSTLYRMIKNQEV